MVHYDNCRFQVLSGALSGVNGIAVQMNIQTGNRTTLISSAAAYRTSMKMYARWKNGDDGEPVLTKNSVLSIEARTDDSIGSVFLRVTVLLNELKDFNSIDYIELDNNGDIDTYSFNKYYYLIQTGPSVWGSREDTIVRSQSSFTPELTLEADGSFTGQISSSYDKSSYDIYISGILAVANLGGIVLPYELPLRVDSFVFSGVIEEPDNVRYQLQVGRISDRVPEIILKPDIVNELGTPTIPNSPTNSSFTPLVITVEKDNDNKLVCNFIINPTPLANRFTSMTLRQRRISTPVTDFDPTVTNNYQTRSLTGQVVEDGETVRIQLVMIDEANFKHESVFYDYTQVDGELQLNTNFYEQQSIKSTKIHVTKVREDTIDLLLINDRFNDEFVNSVTATVQGSDPPITETIQNNFMSSNIEISLIGLSVDSEQVLIISATAGNSTFEIQRVGVKTTISIPDEPTDDQKKMQSMQRIIHMAYDNDSIEDIEGLGVDSMGNITRDVLTALQEPSNLGVVYDRNRSNRKGSVYNKGESDTVRHNYPKTLEQILASNPIDIPTVSEGYN